MLRFRDERTRGGVVEIPGEELWHKVSRNGFTIVWKLAYIVAGLSNVGESGRGHFK